MAILSRILAIPPAHRSPCFRRRCLFRWLISTFYFSSTVCISNAVARPFPSRWNRLSREGQCREIVQYEGILGVLGLFTW
jgi:hypothetical protein